MLNTSKPVDIVCFWDPAIDAQNSNIDRYIRGRDIEDLVYRDGAKPTIYRARALTSAHALRMLASTEGDLGTQQEICFRYAVYRVQNATLLNGDFHADARPRRLVERGQSADSMAPPDADDLELWSADEVYESFDYATVMEIGGVVRQRTFLPRGIGRDFLLPPTSQQLLGGKLDLFAAWLLGRYRDGKISKEHLLPALKGAGFDVKAGDVTAITKAIFQSSEDATPA